MTRDPQIVKLEMMLLPFSISLAALMPLFAAIYPHSPMRFTRITRTIEHQPCWVHIIRS